jgi:hypothetical protein
MFGFPVQNDMGFITHTNPSHAQQIQPPGQFQCPETRKSKKGGFPLGNQARQRLGGLQNRIPSPLRILLTASRATLWHSTVTGFPPCSFGGIPLHGTGENVCITG